MKYLQTLLFLLLFTTGIHAQCLGLQDLEVYGINGTIVVSYRPIYENFGEPFEVTKSIFMVDGQLIWNVQYYSAVMQYVPRNCNKDDIQITYYMKIDSNDNGVIDDDDFVTCFNEQLSINPCDYIILTLKPQALHNRKYGHP